MIEVADVFRRFVEDYLNAHGATMPPSHRRTIADILACRTEVLGGHLWRCNHCCHEVFSYHSCRNRSCPKCHTDQTKVWLAHRLATHYFHVVITVPEELRDVLRSNQRDGYALLMKAAAEAIIDLARDRRFVGGTVGILAVLHTWTQQLLYHPHVHCLVTGGGISEDGRDWYPARDAFLLPYQALADRVRGKFRALLASKRPDLIAPYNPAWTTSWVVHIARWGQGAQVGAPVAWKAASSCAASSSTSFPRASTRSAISVSGIPQSVRRPLKRVSSWSSIAPSQHHPRTIKPPSAKPTNPL